MFSRIYIRWLFLSHQIGLALETYLLGILYSKKCNYNLSFYLSIVILIGAVILNLLLPEAKQAFSENKNIKVGVK